MATKSNKVKDLQEQLIAIKAEADAIQRLADDANRELTEEEAGNIEQLFKAFDQTETELKRRERLERISARLDAPGTRVTDPEEPATPRNAGNALTVRDGSRITGGDPAAVANSRGTGGFRSFGEYALSVKNAAGGRVDPRLAVLGAASTTSQEAVGADGGYAVPPDFKTQIMKKVQGEDALLSRTEQISTTSNSVTLPVDETTPWQSTGGVQAYWEGEAQQVPQSKVGLRNVTIRANKLMALVNVTDELLEDAPSLESYLRNKAPEKINYKINDAIINGTGVGMPLGLMNAPALVTQTKEAGQAAGTVNAPNVTKMWGRLYAPLRRDAVWLINQDVEQQLNTMTLGGTSAVMPIYLPPTGLSGSMYSTLFGRPVVCVESCQALGAPGDIILTSMSQYLSVVKSGGIKTDMSMHLFFDQGITAFRFVVRVGGNPYWQAPITRAKSALTLSHAVVLEAR